jgi:hypothetical protein
MRLSSAALHAASAANQIPSAESTVEQVIGLVTHADIAADSATDADARAKLAVAYAAHSEKQPVTSVKFCGGDGAASKMAPSKD